MMKKKVKVSVVSYLNSKPFVYGIKRSKVFQEMDISLDIPSKVAVKLEFNLADIGLVPVAALHENDSLEIVTDKCIGSEKGVRTVVLASQVPFDSIDTILMDYQSRTSVLLAKVLAKFFWKKSFTWENTCSGFENTYIKGNTAGVVIGDRVFEVEKSCRYIYDLSTEWMKYTRLPFVFAVWAANKPIDKNFLVKFNKALESGLAHLKEIVNEENKNYPGIDIFEYLTENIQFNLNNNLREGLKLFLELAKKLEPVELI